MNDDDDDDDNDSEKRWHPYLTLALGALFIVLGIASSFLTHEPDLSNRPPDWWAGAPTSPTPFSLLIGVILLGAGVYALNRNKTSTSAQIDDQKTDRASGGMKFRKLRIAFSVTCGIACALLIVLWVRSYWRFDILHCPTSKALLVTSANGIFQIIVLPNNSDAGFGPGWRWSGWVLPSETEQENRDVATRPSWKWHSSRQLGTGGNFPAWPVAMLLALATASPWLRLSKRFSLRTLLIATTLVAVVLGAIVYAIR